MLQEEFRMVQAVSDAGNISDEDMDDYAIKLAEFLDRKEYLIRRVQSKFELVKNRVARVQELA